MSQDADAIVVGAGLAGLVATAELAAAGRRVILVDQEPEASLGGQAFWSFGGLFLVDSPEQRRLGIRDSQELAWQDWLGNAGFDRPEDEWPRRWAEAYVAFAAGEKRSWLRARGVRFFPVPGWAERGGYGPSGPGNSVPRFHITWGTGPAVIAPFERAVRAAAGTGQVRLLFRHQVDELTLAGGTVDRGAGQRAGPVRGGPRPGQLARGDRRLRAARAGRPGHLGRHRRQPRTGPQVLAGPAGAAARAPAVRRARARGRPDAGHQRGGRRGGDQPGPDVALHRGHHELGADLAGARHPDPARPVVAVARRHGPAAARAAVPRLRHAGHAGTHHEHRVRLHLVPAHREDHRAGVRAVRVRAEPGPDRQEHRRAGAAGPARAAGTGRGVHAPRGRLRGARFAARAGGRHERAHRRRTSSTCPR